MADRDLVSIRLEEIGRTLRDADRRFASAVRKQIRAAVNAAGQDIVQGVRSSASAHGLRKAAAATRMTTSFAGRRAGAKVVVNRRRAPYARPMEMGNRAGGRGAGTFSHPVFGRGHTEQPKRPFFFPAVERRTPAMERRFLDAINQAATDAGFH